MIVIPVKNVTSVTVELLLCRKSTAKIVLISDILLADKADSQPNKRELNLNCLQLQHSYVQSHPRLRQLDETAHRMQWD